jgi:hypothetical protein
VYSPDLLESKACGGWIVGGLETGEDVGWSARELETGAREVWRGEDSKW